MLIRGINALSTEAIRQCLRKVRAAEPERRAPPLAPRLRAEPVVNNAADAFGCLLRTTTSLLMFGDPMAGRM